MPAGDDEILAIRTVTLPRDTNAHGTIFGGYILSLIDQAGAIACHAVGAGALVTVAMHEVEFKAPVRVGDLVSCYARVVRVGRTSIVAGVRVEAVDPAAPGLRGRARDVTEATVVYVQIGEDGRPAPIEVVEPPRDG